MRLRRGPVTDELPAFHDDSVVVTMAPRIRQRLIEAMVRFDDTSRPIAETYRRVGAEAERLGLTRPSYQRIRELVHQARNVRPRLTVTDVIRIVTTRPKTTDHGLELLSELGVKPIALWGLSSERPRPP